MACFGPSAERSSPDSCRATATGQSAAGIAAGLNASTLAGHAQSGAADVYLFAPERPGFRGEAVHVLCDGGQPVEGGSSRAALLDAGVAADATRVGASEGSVNGVSSIALAICSAASTARRSSACRCCGPAPAAPPTSGRSR